MRILGRIFAILVPLSLLIAAGLFIKSQVAPQPPTSVPTPTVSPSPTPVPLPTTASTPQVALVQCLDGSNQPITRGCPTPVTMSVALAQPIMPVAMPVATPTAVPFPAIVPAPPTDIPMPSPGIAPQPMQIRAGAKVSLTRNTVIAGDVQVNGMSVYAGDGITGLIIVLESDAQISAPYGATITMFPDLASAKAYAAMYAGEMHRTGCQDNKGCTTVRIVSFPSKTTINA